MTALHDALSDAGRLEFGLRDTTFAGIICGTDLELYEFTRRGDFNSITYCANHKKRDILYWCLYVGKSEFLTIPEHLIKIDEGHVGIKLKHNENYITIHQLRKLLTFKDISATKHWRVGYVVKTREEVVRGVDSFKGPDPETVLSLGVERLYE